MRKVIRTIGALFSLFALVGSNSAFAFISPYVGASAGMLHGSTASDSISSKKSSGSLFGLNAGIEIQTPLLVKIGLEGAMHKAYLFDASRPGFQYVNPLFLSIRSKFIANLAVMEPYLVLGYGKELVTGFVGDTRVVKKSYRTDYFSIGLGSQIKIYGFSLFAEINYQRSLRSASAIKTRYVNLQVGLKYYIL